MIVILGKIDKFLRRRGMYFMFAGLNPVRFIAVMVFSALICAAVGFKVHIFAVPALFAAGFLLPVVLAVISNRADNDAMMSDIESMYDIIKIQAKAGVFIQDSLMDCYMMCANRRLKSALLELCNRTSTRNTVKEAVDEFNSKFMNVHIDILCIILNQAQTSGRTVQILSDMSEQIRQVRHAHAMKEKGKLERKIEILELLIFIGVLAIGIYSMGTEIMNMLSM